MNIHQDAFSSGQIGSKLWLCEQLEKTKWKSKETAIYGGWYGLIGFLLLSRDKFKVDRVRSYDQDPACEAAADMLNEYFVWKDWRFKAFTNDCNTLQTDADLVINTSTEHFESMQWWNNLKNGTRVVLQGNNMTHDNHSGNANGLKMFCNQFPVSTELYSGELEFNYPTWGFSRYMLIGIK